MDNSGARYFVIFNNKSIYNIDNQTSIIPTLLGKNLEKIKESLINEIATNRTTELVQGIDRIINNGINGSRCGMVDGMVDYAIDCLKTESKMIFFVNKIIPSQEKNTNSSSIINLSNKLGYSSLYEKTTNPRTLSQEEQKIIVEKCNDLSKKYSTLNGKEQDWYFANC